MSKKFILLIWSLTWATCVFGELEENPAEIEQLGGVRGEIRLEVEGARIEAVGPIVVYLESRDPGKVFTSSEEVAQVRIRQISQKFANFDPKFVVVTAGQTLEFPNNDTITHNVLSYSEPKRFDLGLYPKGESKSVRFDHAGVVKIYCSIHKSMNGLIFVSPTPFHMIAGPSGLFSIPEVPAGAFRLKTWNQMLPETLLDVDVKPGRTDEVIVTIRDTNV
jgi:plastocyanin